MDHVGCSSWIHASYARTTISGSLSWKNKRDPTCDARAVRPDLQDPVLMMKPYGLTRATRLSHSQNRIVQATTVFFEKLFKSTPESVGDLCQNPGCSNVDVFTYEEMRLATMHFQPAIVLGEGGIGIVYKGVIDESVRPGYETTNVAIKVLAPQVFQGDREWLLDVSNLRQGSYQLKFCKVSGCVDFSVRGKKVVALRYGSGRVHKVTGLARGAVLVVPSEAMELLHLLVGVMVAGRHRVVLLEMLIGRRAENMSRPRGEPNLVEWARPLLIHKKKLLRILDPGMEEQYSTRIARVVACVAYQCLSYNPRERPVMAQVVEILETFQTQEESQEDALSSELEGVAV
ncbi:hypothetical protein RHSIM_Rhsim01G0108700 [Rhododendron simsii]|uniref:Protein kinase domain-containing protein n=1 Tax=Rhododendron simsii TaxID=118357 RepID=A0A834M1W5_RHOSS|nr:hypothetical protein RHSIM_Rhsim01G0108700 [Rhododendron simsii]